VPTSDGQRQLRKLRSQLTDRRSRLTAGEVAAAAACIHRRVWQLPLLSRCRRVACYLAVRQEVDCGPIIASTLARGREVLLPVLHGRQLCFVSYRPGVAMIRNRFGIPEPAGSGRRPPSGLDVVLVPLVGFDGSGHRLGMGGGYYDRTFRFLLNRHCWRRPHLIGLAYEFQRVPALPQRPWDVPLEMVVTEDRVHRF
jgi:5-formyltetrahydrofolate cyclo-ligase